MTGFSLIASSPPKGIAAISMQCLAFSYPYTLPISGLSLYFNVL